MTRMTRIINHQEHKEFAGGFISVLFVLSVVNQRLCYGACRVERSDLRGH
jgi:hypothetical protein